MYMRARVKLDMCYIYNKCTCVYVCDTVYVVLKEYLKHTYGIGKNRTKNVRWEVSQKVW